MSKKTAKNSEQQNEQTNEQQQVQVQLDDTNATVSYASTVQVRGSAEDITIDFAGPLRSTSPKIAKLTIDQRIILNPYAAKRLALAIGQAISQYEKTYGQLELDPRKRVINANNGDTASKPSAPAGKKLS